MKKVTINQEEVKDSFLLQEENLVDNLIPTEEEEIEISNNAPFIYIKKNVPGYYVEMPNKLDEEQFDNIGETLSDFDSGKWVLLSKEQVKFREDNPNASIKEVFDMELKNETYIEPSEEELLRNAKDEKIHQLNLYDNSSDVNEFSINEEIKTWFTPEQRANYKNSIDSAKLLGVNNLQLFINNDIVDITTDKAAQLLAMIQLYADTCYIVTKQHENAINVLDSVEDVESYDYTTGYPQKLNFEL